MASRVIFSIVLFAAFAGMGFSQEDRAPNEGWRKFGEPRGESAQRGESAPEGPRPSQPPPPQLTLPSGTWISVRVDAPISSNHNLAGDRFTATLSQPLIADGFVVARRGQIVEGRVVEVRKGGRVQGTSKLGLELIEVSLADGRQVPMRSQLVEYSGPTDKGRDATAVATTAALGAAIGGAASGGSGAGIGAGAGAAAGVIGVLATRGRATTIEPEGTVRFRLIEPLTVSTERASDAFQTVRQADYEPKLERRVARRQPSSPPYWLGGGPMWGPYWGSTGVWIGGRRGFGGRNRWWW